MSRSNSFAVFLLALTFARSRENFRLEGRRDAEATESVGNRSERTPAEVSPENGERAPVAREAGRLGAERGEPRGGGVGTEQVQRNGAPGSAETSEAEQLPPAERGG